MTASLFSGEFSVVPWPSWRCAGNVGRNADVDCFCRVSCGPLVITRFMQSKVVCACTSRFGVVLWSCGLPRVGASKVDVSLSMGDKCLCVQSSFIYVADCFGDFA
jgi:hypothetical protein